MRRSTIVVTALALGALGLGAWILFRPKPVPGTPPAPPVEAHDPAVPTAPAPKFTLPPEPEPPAPGTSAHADYFKAMIAGAERGLAAARKGLADAKAAQGRTDPAYLQTLESMERTYIERLDRHRGAIGVSPD